MDTLGYTAEQTYEKKEHFPVFMMGNSMQTLVRARQTSSGTLQSMEDLKNESINVKMLGMPHDTFFFHQMDREEKRAVFNAATFFNKQASGLRLNELENDENLRKLLKPLATFSSNSNANE